jgi:hypothetical protein
LHNVLVVYDVFASPIKETVGFQGLQKCGCREAWERSDLADRNPRGPKARSIYRPVMRSAPICLIYFILVFVFIIRILFWNNIITIILKLFYPIQTAIRYGQWVAWNNVLFFIKNAGPGYLYRNRVSLGGQVTGFPNNAGQLVCW